MPSHPLKNPFEIPKERDPDRVDFVGKVLGSKKGKKYKLTVENFEEKELEDLVLSEADKDAIEKEKIIPDLMARERLALRKFFGKEIPVPPLPPEITVEKIKTWEALDLHLHYLPNLSVAELERGSKGGILGAIPMNFPGWKEKPSMSFFNKLETGALPPEAAQLLGGWMLVEARPKPAYDHHNYHPVYPNDFLGPVLKKLNKKGIIRQASRDGRTPFAADSRYGLSSKDLDDPRVRKAIAEAVHVPEENLSLPRAIEFNILGNIFYPEWGKTDTAELFEGRYPKLIGRMFGGNANFGGLSDLDGIENSNNDLVGFRVIGHFFTR